MLVGTRNVLMVHPNRPRISALLIDLSGTLHIGNTPTKSAPDALQRLRLTQIPLRFCSNTSSESRKDVCKRLMGMGFSFTDREVWTSLRAVSELLRKRNLTR